MVLKKVCITIGLEYPGTSNELFGCYNDANLIEKTMKDIYNFNDNEIISIRDKPDNFNSGKNDILKILNGISKEEEAYDFVVFYAACHGVRVTDYNGDEESKDPEYTITMQGGKARDSAIVTSEKNRETKLLLDDELAKIWSQFPKKTNILNIYDCCHSGSMSDLTYYYLIKNLRTIPEQMQNENLENIRIFTKKNYEFTNKKLKNKDINCLVLSLSGARDQQYTYEFKQMGQTHGHFTVTICNLFKNILKNRRNSEIEYSIGDLIRISALKINNSKQIPVLSSSQPIDINATYIIDIPFKITLLDNFDQKIYEPIVKPNQSLLQHLFGFLNRGNSMILSSSSTFFLIIFIGIILIFKDYLWILVVQISNFLKNL